MVECLVEKQESGECEVESEQERRVQVVLPSYEDAEVREYTKGGGENAFCRQSHGDGAHPNGH